MSLTSWIQRLLGNRSHAQQDGSAKRRSALRPSLQITRLEPRRVLNGNPLVAIDDPTVSTDEPAEIVVDAGDEANDQTADTFRVTRDGDSVHVTVNDRLVETVGLDQVASLRIVGSADSDTLIVDLSNGNPIPLGGLSFDGGDATDTLILEGGNADTVTHIFDTTGAGSVSIDGLNINYENVEPIVDSLAANHRNITTTVSTADLALSDADGTSLSRIDTALAMSITFANPGESLTITSTHSDGGSISVTGVDSSFNANLSITNFGGITVDSEATLRSIGGDIHLDAGDSGVLKVYGTLDVSNSEADQLGGNIHLLGNHVGLFDDARLDASGGAGGGVILIGGDFQGGNPEMRNAQRTFFGPDAVAIADALSIGDGGKVIVWADQITRYYGNISAQGGTLAGDGGFIEVSGKGYLEFKGRVNAQATNGTFGTLLLDPKNATTQGMPNAGGGTAPNVTNNDAFSDNAAGDTTFEVRDILEALRTADVRIQANTDVFITTTIDATDDTDGNAADRNGRTIEFEAGRSIIISPNVTIRTRNVASTFGEIILQANHFTAQAANRDPGTAVLQMGDGSTLDAGAANITLEINDGPSGTEASGDIIIENIISTGNVRIQNEGNSVGSGIVMASTDGLIQANDLELDLPGAGGATDGEIGTMASPIRVQVTGDLAVRGQSAGVFINSPNSGIRLDGNDAVGGIPPFNRGIQTSANGSVSLTAAGTITISDQGSIDANGAGTVTVATTSGDIVVESPVGAGAAAGIVSGTGTISVNAAGNVNLSTNGIQTGNTTSNAVSVTTGASGSIIDSSNNMTANITSGGGISLTAATAIGEVGDDLDIATATQLTVDTNGDFRIRGDGTQNLSDLTLTLDPAGAAETYSLANIAGLTTFTLADAGANIGITDITDSGLNFTLNTDTGNVGVTNLNVGTGTVTLNPAGSITTEDGISGATDITAGTANLNANVAPGASPGQLVIDGDVTFGGADEFQVELNGTTAGTQYDQLRVLGANRTVTLNNTTLALSVGFTPTVGNMFTIIENVDMNSSISGTFNGLIEGAPVTAGGQNFMITYMGGTDSNDVVLTSTGAAVGADFTLAAGTSLTLNNFGGGSNVTVSDDGTNYLFALAAGNWNGTDGGGVTGNGMSTLTVTKAALNALTTGLIINDSVDNDPNITFNDADSSIDFSGMMGSIDIDGVGAVNQTGTTGALITQAFDVNGASVDLDDVAANDFQGNVTSVTTAGGAAFVDANTITFANASSTAGGNNFTAQATTINFTNGATVILAGAGDLTLTGAVVLADGATVALTADDVTFTSTIEGATNGTSNLTVNASGTTTFGGRVGGTTAQTVRLATLTTDMPGMTVFAVTGAGGSSDPAVFTTGQQQYGDNVVLNENSAFRANNSSITFNGMIEAGTAGSPTLLLEPGSSTVQLNDTVGATNALRTLTTQGNSNLIINTSSIRTTSDQLFIGRITLMTNTQLTTNNGNITFRDRVDGGGTSSLTLDAGNAGIISVQDAADELGSTGTMGPAASPINGLTITNAASVSVFGVNSTNGVSINTNAGNITIGGNVSSGGGTQTFSEPVVLDADVSFTSTNQDITFANTIQGLTSARDLTVNAGNAAVSFGGAIGGNNLIDAIDIDGGATPLVVSQNITGQGSVDVNIAGSTLAVNVGTRIIAGAGGTMSALNVSAAGVTLNAGGMGTETLTNSGTGTVSVTSTGATNININDNAVANGSGIVSFNAGGSIVDDSGDTDATPEMTVAGPVSLTAGGSIGATGAAIDIAGATALTFDANDNVFIDGDGVTALTSLSTTVDPNGAATYTLSDFANLTTYNVTTNAPNLTVTNITTTGNVAISITAKTGNLTAQTLESGTGAISLAATTGDVTLSNAIGATNRPSSLTVSGNNLNLNNAQIDVGNNVDFSGVTNLVTLGANVLIDTNPTMAGEGNVTFNTAATAEIRGANQSLTINVADNGGMPDSAGNDGDVTLPDTIGTAAMPLGALSVTADTGTVTIGGGQTATYNTDAITIGSTTLLTANTTMNTGGADADFSSSFITSDNMGPFTLTINTTDGAGANDGNITLSQVGDLDGTGTTNTGVSTLMLTATDGMGTAGDLRLERDTVGDVSIELVDAAFTFNGGNVEVRDNATIDTEAGNDGTGGAINLNQSTATEIFAQNASTDLALTLDARGQTTGGQVTFGLISDDATAGEFLGAFTARTNGAAASNGFINLDNNITIDDAAGAGTAVTLEGRVEVDGAPTITTQEGNNNASANIDLSQATIYAEDAGDDLTLDSSSATGQNAGNVSLNVFSDDGTNESFVQLLDIDADNGGGGGTAGNLTLNGGIQLDDATAGNEAALTFNGANVIVSNTLTINTSNTNDNVAAGLVNLNQSSTSQITADAIGFTLTINTNHTSNDNTNDNEDGGAVTLGTVTDADGAVAMLQFLDSLVINTNAADPMDSDGIVALQGDISVDNGAVTIDGDIQLPASRTIDTEQGDDEAGGNVSLAATNGAVSATAAGVILTINSSGGTGTAAGGNVTLGLFDDPDGIAAGATQFVHQINIDADAGSGGGGTANAGSVTLANDILLDNNAGTAAQLTVSAESGVAGGNDGAVVITGNRIINTNADATLGANPNTNVGTAGVGGAVTLAGTDAYAVFADDGNGAAASDFTLSIVTATTAAGLNAGNVTLGAFNNNSGNGTAEFVGGLLVNASGPAAAMNGTITLRGDISTDDGNTGAGAAGNVELIGTVALPANRTIDTNQTVNSNGGIVDLDQAAVTAAAAGVVLTLNTDAGAGTGSGGNVQLGLVDDTDGAVATNQFVHQIIIDADAGTNGAGTGNGGNLILNNDVLLNDDGAGTAAQFTLSAEDGPAGGMDGTVVLQASTIINTNADQTVGAAANNLIGNAGAGGAVTFANGTNAYRLFADDGNGAAAADFTLSIITATTAATQNGGAVTLGLIDDGGGAGTREFLGGLTVNSTGTATNGTQTLRGNILTDDGMNATGGTGAIELIGDVAGAVDLTIDTNQTAGQNAGLIDLDSARFGASAAGVDITLNSTASGGGNSGNINLGDVVDPDGTTATLQRIQNLTANTSVAGGGAAGTLNLGDSDAAATGTQIEVTGTIDFTNAAAVVLTDDVLIDTEAPGDQGAAVNAGSVNFAANGTIEGTTTGQENLSIDTTEDNAGAAADGNVVLTDIGNTTPLRNVRVIADTGSITLNDGADGDTNAEVITNTGNVTFGSSTVLAADAVITTTGGTIDFSRTDVSTNGGSFDLTLDTSNAGGAGGNVLLSNFNNNGGAGGFVNDVTIDTQTMALTTGGNLTLNGTIQLDTGADTADFILQGATQIDIRIAGDATINTENGGDAAAGRVNLGTSNIFAVNDFSGAAANPVDLTIDTSTGVGVAGGNVSIGLVDDNNGEAAALFNTATTPGGLSSPVDVVTGDFNGDGNLDFLVANGTGNNAQVLLGDGSGSTFTAPTNIGVGTPQDAIAVGDFNNDGNLDFIIADNGTNNVRVLLGNGSGTMFPTSTTIAVGTDPEAIAVGDFNADGNLDVAVANNGSMNVTILLGNGTGTAFASTTVAGVGNGPSSIAIGDFDGANGPDLAVSNDADNTVRILTNNGAGTFALGASLGLNTGTTPESVIVGDFDGMNGLDIATANAGTGNVSVLLNNGAGAFGAATNFVVGTSPQSVTAADADGDGDLDLVTANSGSMNVSVILNNGTATFGTATNINVGNGPQSVVAGDFNGDGNADLVVANQTDSTASVLQGNARFLNSITIDSRGNNGASNGDVTLAGTGGDADISTDGTGANAIQLSGDIVLTQTLTTFDTEQGNDGAAGGVNLTNANVTGDATAGRDLTINTATTANTQNGGPVSLGAFIDLDAAGANNTFVNDVIVTTTGGAGGTSGTVTLNQNISLDNAAADVASFSVNSGVAVANRATTVLTASITIDTEGDNMGNAGDIDLSGANVTADNNVTRILTLDTRGDDGANTGVGNGGNVTLGSFIDADDTGGNVNQFVNQVLIMSDAGGMVGGTGNGGVLTFGGDVLLDNNGGTGGQVNFTSESGTAGGNDGRIVITADTIINTNSDDTTGANPNTNLGTAGTGGTVTLANGPNNSYEISGDATAGRDLSIVTGTTDAAQNGGNIRVGNFRNTGGTFVNDVLLDSRGTGSGNNGSIFLGPTILLDDDTAGGTGDLTARGNVRLERPSTLIDTEQANSAAGGSVDFSAATLSGDATMGRSLTINTGTTAAAQNGGAVSLDLFDNSGGTFVQGLSINTNAGTGGTAGATTLNDNISLDDNGTAAAFLRVTGGGNIVLTTNVTIDTEDGNTMNVSGGLVDLSDATVTGDATVGRDLTINTNTTGAGANGGNVQLGSFGSGGGTFIHQVQIDATSTMATPGNLTLGGNISLDDDTATAALFQFTGNDVIVRSDTTIDTENLGSFTGGAVNLGTSNIFASNSDVDFVINSSTSAGQTGGAVNIGLVDDNNGEAANLFTNTTTPGGLSAPLEIATGDFNNDGVADFLVANNGNTNVRLLLGDGTGNNFAGSNIAVGVFQDSIAVSDFNNDGNQDFVFIDCTAPNVRVALGNGDGTFVLQPNVNVGGDPFQLTTGDFNNDGNIDVAVADFGMNRVNVLLGNGIGGFAAPVNFGLGAGAMNPQSIVAADINGDGNLDIAVANNGSNDVRVLLGDGTGTFNLAANSPFALGGGTGPVSLVAADLDNMNGIDLVVVNQTTSNITVFLNDGAGGTAFALTANNIAVGTAPTDVTVADFNGDGFNDLAVTNAGADDDVAVLINSGNGTTFTRTDFAAGNNPRTLVAADIDNDGAFDLVAANNIANTATVLISNAQFLNSLVVNADAINGANDGIVTLSGDISVDNATVTVDGDIRITATRTIESERGDDAAGGTINLAATSGSVSGTAAGFDLNINSNTTAAGQTGGNVSLGVFNSAGNNFINDVNINTTGAAGSGSTTLNGNVSLDDDAMGDLSSLVVTGNGNVIISASLTVDTEQGGDAAGGLVNLNASNVSADALGNDLSIDTRGAAIGGNITANNFNNAGGQFINDMSLDTRSTTNGVISLGTSISTDHDGAADPADVTIAGEWDLTGSTTIDTEDGNANTAGTVDTQNASVSATAAGQNLTINANTTAAGQNGGNVTLGVFDNLDNMGAATLQLVNNLTINASAPATGGNILFTQATAITDTVTATGRTVNDAGVLAGGFIRAPNLAMTATNGIGSAANPLNTAVSFVAANNTAAGEIQISNNNAPNGTSLLTIAVISGVTGVTNASGGNTTIINNSPLTVAANVLNTNGGNISLTAATAGDLTVNSQVAVTGGSGNVTLFGGTNVIINDGGAANDIQVVGAGGIIDIDANNSVTIGAGVLVNSSGTIDIDAGTFNAVTLVGMLQTPTGIATALAVPMDQTPKLSIFRATDFGPAINVIVNPDINNLGGYNLVVAVGANPEFNMTAIVNWGALFTNNTGLAGDPGGQNGGTFAALLAGSRTFMHTYISADAVGADNFVVVYTLGFDSSIQIDAGGEDMTEAEITVAGVQPGDGISSAIILVEFVPPPLFEQSERSVEAETPASAVLALPEAASGAVGGGDSAQAGEGSIVLILIRPDNTSQEFDLPQDILEGEKLVSLLKKLPDGRYRVVQKGGENRPDRTIRDVFVRQGQLVDPSNDSGDGQQDDMQDGADGQTQSLRSETGGSQTVGIGETTARSEAEHPDALGKATNETGLVNQRADENSDSQSAARRFDNVPTTGDSQSKSTSRASLLTKSAIGAAALLHAHQEKWEDRADSAIENHAASGVKKSARLLRRLKRRFRS